MDLAFKLPTPAFRLLRSYQASGASVANELVDKRSAVGALDQDSGRKDFLELASESWLPGLWLCVLMNGSEGECVYRTVEEDNVG